MKFLNKLSVLLLILYTFIPVKFCGAATLANDFSGTWCSIDDNNWHAFSIVIKRVLNEYKGDYSAVAFGGNRIDDNENAFSFKATDKNNIKTKIKAGITGNTGIVNLKLLDKNTIEWTILKDPEGDFYVPLKTFLHKC